MSSLHEITPGYLRSSMLTSQPSSFTLQLSRSKELNGNIYKSSKFLVIQFINRIHRIHHLTHLYWQAGRSFVFCLLHTFYFAYMSAILFFFSSYSIYTVFIFHYFQLFKYLLVFNFHFSLNIHTYTYINQVTNTCLCFLFHPPTVVSSKINKTTFKQLM